jgi:hypothetical protein
MCSQYQIVALFKKSIDKLETWMILNDGELTEMLSYSELATHDRSRHALSSVSPLRAQK